MDKFEPLRKAHTNGANYELDTDAVIKRLKQWDAKYGIELSGVDASAVTVRFQRLPKDVMPLAEEIYAFCPDTIDQGFGVIGDMVDETDEEELPEGIAELIEGVDFSDDDYGLELLKRSLVAHKKVDLWWD